jgi:hypothetical protein
MAIDYRIDGETMEDVYRIKKELSLRHFSISPEERRKETRKALDRFAARTGKPMVFVDPPPKRKHQAG